MNNIVITGATGFVGSNLAKFLLNENLNIYLIVREKSDISNLIDIKNKVHFFVYNNNIEQLVDFFKKVKPKVVFHLASNFIAEHSSNQIDSLIDSNISFGLHILEAMKVAEIKNLINTGTSWQHYNNEEYNPVCLYAATKQAFEMLIEYYVKAECFNVITLKLFDTYGENDKRPKLINLLHRFADEKTELKMSPGEQILNLTHILDVCKAYLVAMKMLTNDSIINEHKKYVVNSNENYKLKEVISLFENITNKRINIIWGGKQYRKREVMQTWSKGIRLPNWKPSISLKKGLELFK